MRSRTFTLRVPNPVFDAVEQRAALIGYCSPGEYLVGRARADLILKPADDLGLWIARMPRGVQDYIDDRIAVPAIPIIGAQSASMEKLCESLVAGLPSHLAGHYRHTQGVLHLMTRVTASGVDHRREAA